MGHVHILTERLASLHLYSILNVLPCNTCLGQTQIKLILEQGSHEMWLFCWRPRICKECREWGKGLELNTGARKNHKGIYIKLAKQRSKAKLPLTQL